MSQHYNIAVAVKAHAKACEEKGWPDFTGTNGRCFDCGKNIFQPVITKSEDGKSTYIAGYSVQEAVKGGITGCPFCHRSYCD